MTQGDGAGPLGHILGNSHGPAAGWLAAGPVARGGNVARPPLPCKEVPESRAAATVVRRSAYPQIQSQTCYGRAGPTEEGENPPRG